MVAGADRLDVLLLLLSTGFIFGVFANLLPVMLANDDGAYYANMILSLRPGWMDGKPVYIWIGYIFSEFASFLGFKAEFGSGLWTIFRTVRLFDR